MQSNNIKERKNNLQGQFKDKMCLVVNFPQSREWVSEIINEVCTARRLSAYPNLSSEKFQKTAFKGVRKYRGTLRKCHLTNKDLLNMLLIYFS